MKKDWLRVALLCRELGHTAYTVVGTSGGLPHG